MKMSGAEQVSASGTVDEPGAPATVPDQALVTRFPVALFEEEGEASLAYLRKRGFHDETLIKYGVGHLQKRFFDDEAKCWRAEDCVSFPWIEAPRDGLNAAVTTRYKVRSIEAKKHMRLEPTGGGWGLFGLHTVPEDCEEIVLTEGEYDALAVHQATGRHADPLELRPADEDVLKVRVRDQMVDDRRRAFDVVQQRALAVENLTPGK